MQVYLLLCHMFVTGRRDAARRGHKKDTFESEILRRVMMVMAMLMMVMLVVMVMT